ncbi:MAG: tripartite tricarboxylate transporter substrate binding protein [Burkholderiales bacterium]
MTGADMMQRWTIAIALGVLTLSAVPSTAAEAPYPNRPVRMLIPYPAGGGLDLPGRAVAQKFADSTGQQMVIDNRGGAGGLIAGEIVAKATPDGYTLFLASNGQISIAPALYPKLPYDPLRDLVPITHFVDTPMVLFVNAQYPVHSVAELIAAAKAKPGTIGCALSGVGGVSHLTLELFKLRANVNLLPVPYRGAAIGLADVAGGSVPAIFSTLAAAKPLLDGVRIRALAVASAKRTGSLPSLPTFAELGYAGMDAPLWIGMMAPKGTPAGVIAKLDAEFRKALAAADVKERLATQSADIIAGGPREFGDMIRRDTARWAEVVKVAHIKIE